MAGRPGWTPYVKTIAGVPQVRDCYWFNMPCAIAPEIPDWHPCIVIRGARNGDERQSTVTIVPLTSSEPTVPRKGIVQLTENPNPTDDRTVWALCEFAIPIGLFRLEQYTTRRGSLETPQISKEDLERVLDGVVNGNTVLARRVKQLADARLDALQNQFETRIAEMNTEFEARLESALFDQLEELTRPPE